MAGAEHDYVVYQRGEEGESDAWDDTVLIKAYDNAVSAMKAKLAEQHPEFSSAKPSLKTKKKKKNKPKSKKKQKHHLSNHVRWKVGDLCQAVYSVDGEIYEAKIVCIDDAKQTCTLEYVDYGNTEEQLLSELLPIGSPASSQEQQTDTASETESVSKAQNVPASFNKQRNKRSSSHQHFQGTQHVPKWPWNEFPPAPPFGHMPAPPPSYPQFQPPHSFPGFQAHGSTSIPPMFPCVPPPPPLFTERGSGDENEALYSMLISWYMSGYHTGYYQGLKQSAANASAASGHRSYR